MDDEHGEHPEQPEPERLVVATQPPEELRGGREERDVEEDAEDPELGRHGERRRVRGRPALRARRPVSSRLAAGCDATPTPSSGWFPNTAHVSWTSVQRPLTTRFTEWSRTSVTNATAPRITTPATAAAISLRVRRPPARAVTSDRRRGERDHARLRVREVEADPDERDERRAEDDVDARRAAPRRRGP